MNPQSCTRDDVNSAEEFSLKLNLHLLRSPSAARLSSTKSPQDSWLCVPASRRVCLYRVQSVPNNNCCWV